VDERACTLECPKHGSEFDLRTGVPRSLPALRPVPTYDVTVVDGDVFVEIGVSS
jgi:3-phenylpropionate/trans-cinnamate dioxygenase ferredoxin subunit